LAFLGIVPSIGTLSGTYASHTDRRDWKKREKAKRLKPGGNGGKQIDFALFVHENPQSQVAESCRAIRTNLLFMSADQPAQKILITSPSPQEGKTTVAINLAIVMAQSGSRVLLVDTDLRRPRVHSVFGVTSRHGISTVVLGESNIAEAVVHTDIPNLDIILCGPIPPNPAELMHTESFARSIQKLSERYDRIIFDSPPVGAVTDAAILSKLVDGTVLIVKSLQTTRDALKHSFSVFTDINAKVLGAVLNDMDLNNRKYGRHYYYHYYKKYGYYYNQDDSKKDSAASADEKPSMST
jgi:capsular exopolysaccharide synthesis family protein